MLVISEWSGWVVSHFVLMIFFMMAIKAGFDVHHLTLWRRCSQHEKQIDLLRRLALTMPAETMSCLRENLLMALEGCAEKGVIQKGFTIPYEGHPYDSKYPMDPSVRPDTRTRTKKTDNRTCDMTRKGTDVTWEGQIGLKNSGAEQSSRQETSKTRLKNNTRITALSENTTTKNKIYDEDNNTH